MELIEQKLPPVSMKGIVKLTIRDAETLEVIREHEQENAITICGSDSLTWGNEGDSWLGGTGVQIVNASEIAISDRIIADNLITAHRLMYMDASGVITTNASPGEVYGHDITQQNWTFFPGSPDYAEIVGRFNAPGTARTINSIYLGAQFASSNFRNFSQAALSVPCSQGTSEVLDVTYRIQFFYQTPLGGNALPVSVNYGQAIAQKMVKNDYAGFPIDQSYQMCAVPPDGSLYYGTITDNSNGGDSGLPTQRRASQKLEFNNTETISENIGRVVRSIGYGNAVVGLHMYSTNTELVPGGGTRSTAWAPIAPDDFPNKPIQTIHNHAAAAIEWGLDVDFLSTGQGTLTLDGSSWTNPNWPEFYRIDHSLSGQVATSRYSFRKRATVGFNGNGYRTRRDNFFLQKWQANSTVNYNNNKTIVNGHGLRSFYQMIEYDEQTVVCWDSSGVTTVNANTSEVSTFDTNTTPQLNLAAIRQCAVDASGNIWVADSAQGLYKIADPLGSPVITHMTEATNSLPVGSEDNCYGVAVGFGGDMIALVEGGLIRSTNPTGATPTFATETFTYTGISDSNWNRVDYIVVDRDSDEFELALIRSNTAPLSGSQTVVWWSTNGTDFPAGAATAGPTTSTISGSRYGKHDCSMRGGLWARMSGTTANTALQILDHGTTTTNQHGSGGNTGYSKPTFGYDYYDTPYLCRCSTNNDYGPGVWDAGGNKYCEGEAGAVGSNYTSYSGQFFMWQTGAGKGIHLNNNLGTDAAGENTIWPNMIYQFNAREAALQDPLNGQYSPMEEMVWERYGYNGAAWVENFFADADDTGTHASGPFDGTRHNFDVEDHTFTGRSMIDITSAMAAGNFASSANATFVFKLVPDAKLSTASLTTSALQEKPRVLLDISDDTQQFQIVWDDDIQGNITIVEDGDGGTVIASTPTNGSTYRLVVTIAGTAVNVYLDGNTTPIGTVTLANAYDWDNGDGQLKAFLGCEMFNWDYSQRHTPWQTNFYRGVMENVQLWNVTWNTTDVTNDFGDIDGVIGSQPAANLVARYELTQSLAATETKLSHAGAEALHEGITIAFANGASPTAFIGGDYHTFGVVDGIFKDNAIAYTQQYNIFTKPVDLEFSTFDNGSAYPAAGGNTVLNATTAIVDELAIFTEIVNPPVDLGISSWSGTTHCDRLFVAPGQIFQSQLVTPSTTTSYGGMTVQPITGDGWFEGGPCSNNEWTIFGLTSTPGSNHSASLIDFGFYLQRDGTVDIHENNVQIVDAVATYVVGDVFRVRRIGTAVTYYKNGVLIHTSAATSSGTIYGRVHPIEESYGLTDCRITYTRPARVLAAGNPATLTGIYDPDYSRCETLTPESISINIGGSPATVVVSDTYWGNMTVPGPGEVVFNGKSGWLSFNAADDGAAITGDITVIFEKT
jgi:hypothetical protein